MPVDNVDVELQQPSAEILIPPAEDAELPVEVETPSLALDQVEIQPIAVEVAEEEVKESESDNVIQVVNNVTRSNESGSNEDDIPSFSEWTQKVLAEEEKSG